jgi:asparagine synthase (glutamine-hydrolysing)
VCGIGGFSGPSDHPLLKSYGDKMIHRGPDSEGFYEDESVSLVSRRLRVIDLVTGDQPIHNEDESLWVVFNGEIYNFSRLRSELEANGHKFYTQTDTEILVHLYEDKGEQMVDQLRGMFAFAIYDKGKRRILIARDRFGKKPLYYSFDGNGNLHFASSLRSLLAGKDHVEINEEAYIHYLSYFYNPLKESMVKGIYRLMPSSILVYDQNRRESEIKPYWSVDYSEENTLMTEHDALELIDSELSEAVRIRMISDVPIGVFLSGGVDSSVVTALSSKMGASLKTFSVGFASGKTEHNFARAVSEKFQTDHKEFILDGDVFKMLPRIAESLYEPVGDTSIIPTYFLSSEARQYITVALTGDGGDEAFFGYPWMNYGSLERYFSIPRPLRSLAYAAIKLVSPPTARDLSRYENSNYQRASLDERAVERLTHFRVPEIESIVGRPSISDPRKTSLALMNESKTQKPRRRSLFLTVKQHLPDEFLAKNDNLSMANSLEQRSPLLDHIFFQKAITIPDSFKSDKYIFKKYAIVAGVPKQIVMRPKVGFALPVSDFAKDLRSSLSSEAERSVRTNRSWESNMRLFALAVFSAWKDSIRSL